MEVDSIESGARNGKESILKALWRKWSLGSTWIAVNSVNDHLACCAIAILRTRFLLKDLKGPNQSPYSMSPAVH